jgi:hypothetical protein
LGREERRAVGEGGREFREVLERAEEGAEVVGEVAD